MIVKMRQEKGLMMESDEVSRGLVAVLAFAIGLIVLAVAAAVAVRIVTWGIG